jgi:hypothetical protein
VADNCVDKPTGNEGFPGVIERESSCDCVTFTGLEELTPPKLAETVLLPTPWPVNRPAVLIVATCVKEELQVTLLVMSAVLPSLYVPTAAYCCVLPTATYAFCGATDIETGVLTIAGKMPVESELPFRVPSTAKLAVTL